MKTKKKKENTFLFQPSRPPISFFTTIFFKKNETKLVWKKETEKSKPKAFLVCCKDINYINFILGEIS